MKAKNMINRMSQWCIPFVLIVAVFSSCNKDFPNILKQFSEQPNYTSGSSKVLYIIADGVRGKALQQLELPNFRIVTRNALHSFGSLGDFKNTPYTKEAGMTSLMTGVTSTKHKVADNNLANADLVNYPTIIQRIKTLNNDLKSVAFSGDEKIYNSLLKDADKGSLVASDVEVLQKSKEELSNGTSDLIVTHFKEPYLVGSQNSFETNNQAYVNSLKKIDESIGELIETIKKRSTYDEENWLVIITSSIGGTAINTEVDNTAYGDNNRNTVTFFYSPKFSRSLLSRPNSTEIPYDGNALRYTYGSPAVNSTLQDAELYNFGPNTDFTINFFFKSNVTSSHNYPIILSKRDVGFGGNGWNLFMEVRDGNNKIGWNSNISNQTFGTKQVNDGAWHSFTVVVSRSGATDTVKVFTDGVFNAANTISANSLLNNAPLVIGKKAPDGNTGADFQLNNLQIYNTAFSNKDVAELAGKTTVDSSHPKKSNLIGYWPGYDDVGTNKMTDVSGNNKNMVITGPYNWTSFSDVVPYFQPPIRDSFYRLVPNAVDIPFFIYQWFGIVPKEAWGLEGKSWTPTLLVSTLN
ncbi:LamG-like jellyroll fold domain-containing protein [Sphingobacterium bovistauri]|uniref:DUF4983 domain-containing protein n=1 Tax=Sphingobacterium bovistauri TaxID=2781959 RepID=A0ABS7Z8V2_9SPHI|nr:LamG-like jellyroll fold domain-containing protein [Sphingobacterium bovistauri]MCA5005816.1 DUF4983 domain-containing protein [Sphingobacterium bovistauri]